jgi:hypothetical protein
VGELIGQGKLMWEGQGERRTNKQAYGKNLQIRHICRAWLLTGEIMASLHHIETGEIQGLWQNLEQSNGLELVICVRNCE